MQHIILFNPLFPLSIRMQYIILFNPLLPLQDSSDLDLSDIGLMSLYSEVHPTVSYIVHYGINMIAPVYKLQVRVTV